MISHLFQASFMRVSPRVATDVDLQCGVFRKLRVLHFCGNDTGKARDSDYRTVILPACDVTSPASIGLNRQMGPRVFVWKTTGQ